MLEYIILKISIHQDMIKKEKASHLPQEYIHNESGEGLVSRKYK